MSKIEHLVSTGGQWEMLFSSTGRATVSVFPVYDKAIYVILNWGARSDVAVIYLNSWSFLLEAGEGSSFSLDSLWILELFLTVTEEKLGLNDTSISASRDPQGFIHWSWWNPNWERLTITTNHSGFLLPLSSCLFSSLHASHTLFIWTSGV